MTPSKPCEVCGKEIDRGYDKEALERARFCSKECYWKSMKGKSSNAIKQELHTKEMVSCQCGCGTLIPKLDSHYRPRKFVNGHTANGRKRPDAKDILSKNRLKHTKEKHWNWKGGITPANHLLRNTPEYHEWRKSVYKRDNWTCRKCNEKKRHPIAHHIKTFEEYPELRLNLENGLTVCRSCHKKIHKEIGLSTRFNP